MSQILNKEYRSLQSETNYPLVSVIIRTYNRLSFLKEAIQSVQAQTYSNWELIIVDDGSTDGTATFIRQIADPRLSLIVVPHSGHINYLANEGAKKSKGEWLAFLDSDDLWKPEKLERQLQTLKATQGKWGYTAFEFMEGNRRIYFSSEKFLPHEGNVLDKVIAGETGITICSVMIRKDFFDEIGGFTMDTAVREDYEFFLRAASKTLIAYTPEIVVCIREHAGRVYKSRKYPSERTAMAYKTLIDQNKLEKKSEKLAKQKLAFLLSEAAVHRFQYGDYRIAFRQLMQSFLLKDKPRHWLSAFKRGIYAAYKKYFQPASKTGEAKNVAAYNS